MKFSFPPVRLRGIGFAVRYPRLASVLVFLFLFTVSNQVEFLSRVVLKIPLFEQMIVTGVVMATFGALLLAELIRLHRQVVEAQMVRTVASTLSHEINNPLQVIQFSAEKLQMLHAYDDHCVGHILTQGVRIRDVLAKLMNLEREVRLRQDAGFAGLIEIEHS